MGVFDKVWVTCPECGEGIEFQSKAGDCMMDNYTLDNVPKKILSSIKGEAEACERCHTVVKIVVRKTGYAKRMW